MKINNKTALSKNKMVRARNNQHRDNNDIQTKSSRSTDDDINDWAKRNKRRLGDFWITCREMRQSKSYDNFRTSCNETPRRSGVVLMGFRSRRLPKRPERTTSFHRTSATGRGTPCEDPIQFWDSVLTTLGRCSGGRGFGFALHQLPVLFLAHWAIGEVKSLAHGNADLSGDVVVVFLSASSPYPIGTKILPFVFNAYFLVSSSRGDRS